MYLQHKLQHLVQKVSVSCGLPVRSGENVEEEGGQQGHVLLHSLPSALSQHVLQINMRLLPCG